jgi:ATP-dependent Lon protease
MTGEITLRGRVLPIGGVKEKLLAAHRGNLKTVIIPKDNEKDLAEVPSNVLKALEIVFVEHMDDVLKVAFVPDPSAGSSLLAGDPRKEPKAVTLAGTLPVSRGESPPALTTH